MVFSSITFLFYFLPIFLVFYFVVPFSLKNRIIFVGSLIFYAWGEPFAVFILLFSIALCYILGLFIEKNRKNKAGKTICILGCGLFVVFLLYFKYLGFFLETIHFPIPLFETHLPIGISFYTFQIISYLVDVYRGEKAQNNFIDLGTYIALFPQLIAGPIVRYGSICHQLVCRKHSIEQFGKGIERFVVGLSKKVLLADSFALFIAEIHQGAGSILGTWMYAVAIALQIYFDFSGYSDMAIGLGKMLGFHIDENFAYPFVATNITDFWRRWHISLGSWFRDYIYIPLGGNRCSLARQMASIMFVWILTGLWHGAQWNFVIWGLYFGVLLILEKYQFGEFFKGHPILEKFYFYFSILISFIIFDSSSWMQILETFKRLVGMSAVPIWNQEILYYGKSYALLFVIGMVGTTPWTKIVREKFQRSKFSKGADGIEILFLFLIFLVCIAFLVDGSFSPFLYFRF